MRQYRKDNPEYVKKNVQQNRERRKKNKKERKKIPRPRRQSHIPKDVPKLEKSVKELAKEFDRRNLVDSIQIVEKSSAFRGTTKSFDVSIVDEKDPAEQLELTRSRVRFVIIRELAIMMGLFDYETLKITFSKDTFEGGDTFGELVPITIYKEAYFNSTSVTVFDFRFR